MVEIYGTSKNRALIIVIYRHSSVFSCDKVYLLDKGRIIDKGKYADLKKQTFIINSLNVFPIKIIRE